MVSEQNQVRPFPGYPRKKDGEMSISPSVFAISLCLLQQKLRISVSDPIPAPSDPAAACGLYFTLSFRICARIATH